MHFSAAWARASDQLLYFYLIAMRHLLFCCTVLCCMQAFMLSEEVFAQTSSPTSPLANPPVRFGIFGNAAFMQQTPAFVGKAPLDNYPQDSVYFKRIPLLRLVENPVQWNIGVSAEIPLLPQENGGMLGFTPRLGVQSFSSRFTSTSAPFETDRVLSSSIVDITVQSQALFLHADVLLYQRFGDVFFRGASLSIFAGSRIITALSEQSTQTLTLTPSVVPTPPDDAQPLFGTPFSLINAHLTGGLSFDIPLDGNGNAAMPPTLFLSPEAFYDFGLGDFSNNLRAAWNQAAPSWKVNMLRAGISLKFAPPVPKPPESDSFEDNDINSSSGLASSGKGKGKTSSTNKASKQGLQADITSFVGLAADGRRIENPILKIEEFIGSSSRYLLPYIFFGEKTSTIPERYVRLSPQEISSFSPEAIITQSRSVNHELDAYYQLLNIIGQRMRKYTAAQLTLTGTSDNDTESTDKTLPLRRAEAVKTYLREVWGIAATRIITKSDGSQGTTELVDKEENRVVEIQSSQPEILEELRYDYTLRTVQPPRVEIETEISASEGLSAWSLTTEHVKKSEGKGQKGKSGEKAASVGTEPPTPQQPITNEQTVNDQATRLSNNTGTTIAPQTTRMNVERTIVQAMNDAPYDGTTELPNTLSFPATFRTTLRARDSVKNSAEDTVSAPMEMLTLAEKRRRNAPDVRVGTYWVFCFNLNSKQLSVDERVRRAVKAIKQNVAPGASVEITGYADTRGNVDKNRKLSNDRAEAVLQLLAVPSSKVASIEGKGESIWYDNDLPEGRFYNRFVRVDIRTPIQHSSGK